METATYDAPVSLGKIETASGKSAVAILTVDDAADLLAGGGHGLGGRLRQGELPGQVRGRDERAGALDVNIAYCARHGERGREPYHLPPRVHGPCAEPQEVA